MALTEKELPVLNDVIRAGDASIIRSTRQRQVRMDPRVATTSGRPYFELPAHLQLDDDVEDDHGDEFDDDVEDELESLIDGIVDKHIEALRNDLRVLLERARELP